MQVSPGQKKMKRYWFVFIIPVLLSERFVKPSKEVNPALPPDSFTWVSLKIEIFSERENSSKTCTGGII